MKIELLPSMLAQNGYQVLAFGDVLKMTDAAVPVKFAGAELFKPGLNSLDQRSLEDILSSLEKIDRTRPFALFLVMPVHGAEPVTPETASPYDDNIKQIDNWLGKLLGELRSRELLGERTLVVITSDRGVVFGSPDFISSQGLFAATTKVPLIVSWPGHLPAREIKSLVRTVDVGPFIFDLFGLPMPGQVMGASLRPMLDAELDLTALIEENSVATNGVPLVDQALRDPLWLFYFSPSQSGLFHLAADPEAKVNLLLLGPHDFPGLSASAREQKLKRLHTIFEFMAADLKNYNFYILRHLKKFAGAGPDK